MSFFFYLGVLLFAAFANRAIARYLQDRVKPPVPAPFQAPNIPTGTVIPVLYGTQRLPGITAWFGNAVVAAVNLNSHTLFGLFPSTRTLTYQWKATMMQLYCWGPVPQLINMVFNNTFSLADQPLTQRLVDPVLGTSTVVPTFVGGEPPFPVSEFGAGFSGNVVWNLFLPNLYGGMGHGGGLTAVGGDSANPWGGNFRFYAGNLGNDQDPVMAAALGAANTPAYGDFCYHIFDDINVGESSVPPAIDIIAYCEPKSENIPGGIGSFGVNARTITGVVWNWPISDISGAAILIDLLCNERYGKGEPLAVIRIGAGNSDGLSGSFEDANRALAAEGLGVSFVFSGNPSDVDTTIATILQHIDGVLRRNPVTQQRELKLIRNEAAVAFPPTPRTFDESSIQSIENWGRPDWDDTLNWITVTFSNAQKLYQQDAVTLKNHANFAMTGSWRGTQVQYLGITDKALAIKIASRDLKKTTLRLWRGQVKIDRSAWDVAEGDVIYVTYSPYKLSNMPLRVLATDRGEETNSVITLDVIEDAFAFDDVAFTSDPGVVPLNGPRIIPPIITAVTSEQLVVSGVQTGQVTITLVDPEHRTYEIAYRTISGGGTASAWTVTNTATPNTGVTGFPYINPVTDHDFNGDHVFQVPLSVDGPSAIEYRVSAIGYGTVASPDDFNIVLDASVDFSILKAPQGAEYKFTDTGDGHVIATGDCCLATFDFAGTITGWKLASKQAATLTFDLWRNNGGSSLPTIANSLGLSFGSVSDVQIASGTFSPTIAITPGDNFVLDILANDLSQYFELTLLIDKTV